jgi:hypothetical protein
MATLTGFERFRGIPALEGIKPEVMSRRGSRSRS